MTEIENIKNLIENIPDMDYDDKVDAIVDNVDQLLGSGKSSDIELLLNNYLDSGNEKYVDPLMEAVTYVIENIPLTIDGKDYESTMQLIPCTFAIKGEKAKLPSIDTIEENIREKLLQEKVIINQEQFHLGTVRLSQEAVSEMKITDWYQMHNDVLGEVMSDGKSNNSELRNKLTIIDDSKTISVFYLVAVIIDRDSNANVLSDIYDSVNNINLWSTMAEGLGEENVMITMFPPTSILEAIDNVTFVMQGLEFDMFFNEHTAGRDVELIYGKVKNIHDEYVVLFVDSEEKTISQYYIYDTQGEPEDFVSVLLNKCHENPNIRLFRTHEPIEDKKLNEWANSELDPDVSDLIDESDEIDVSISKKIFEINNPNFSSFNSNTLH